MQYEVKGGLRKMIFAFIEAELGKKTVGYRRKLHWNTITISRE